MGELGSIYYFKAPVSIREVPRSVSLRKNTLRKNSLTGVEGRGYFYSFHLFSGYGYAQDL